MRRSSTDPAAPKRTRGVGSSSRASKGAGSASRISRANATLIPESPDTTSQGFHLLPTLRTRATRDPRLPTPSTSRPGGYTLDLELPKVTTGLGQSQSMSSLSRVANMRQERLQVILDRSSLLTDAPLDAHRGSSSRNAGRSFLEVEDEIGKLFSAAQSVWGDSATNATPAAKAVDPVEAEKKKEEARKRRAEKLHEMLLRSGRAKSQAAEMVQQKLTELRCATPGTWSEFEDRAPRLIRARTAILLARAAGRSCGPRPPAPCRARHQSDPAQAERGHRRAQHRGGAQCDDRGVARRQGEPRPQPLPPPPPSPLPRLLRLPCPAWTAAPYLPGPLRG